MYWTHYLASLRMNVCYICVLPRFWILSVKSGGRWYRSTGRRSLRFGPCCCSFNLPVGMFYFHKSKFYTWWWIYIKILSDNLVSTRRITINCSKNTTLQWWSNTLASNLYFSDSRGEEYMVEQRFFKKFQIATEHLWCHKFQLDRMKQLLLCALILKIVNDEWWLQTHSVLAKCTKNSNKIQIYTNNFVTFWLFIKKHTSYHISHQCCVWTF
jgi:hypothetical protein